MKLAALNCPYLIVDDIYINEGENNNNEADFVHFISRPITEISVPKNWKSIIYTTREIEPFTWYNIKIKNNIVKTAFLKTGDYSENNMILFSISQDNITLYTGHFTHYNQITNNQFFLNNKDIKNIYLDNKYVSNTDLNEIGKSLKHLIEQNPADLFVFDLPLLGYEDLIIHLAKISKIRIYVDNLRKSLFKNQNQEQYFCNEKDAQIIFQYKKKLTLKKMEKRYRKYNIRTIQLQHVNKNTCLHQHDYLYTVNYEEHPSMIQIQKLIQIIAPEKLYPIFKSIKIPLILKNISMLKKKKFYSHDIDFGSSTSSSGEFENLNIKDLEMLPTISNNISLNTNTGISIVDELNVFDIINISNKNETINDETLSKLKPMEQYFRTLYANKRVCKKNKFYEKCLISEDLLQVCDKKSDSCVSLSESYYNFGFNNTTDTERNDYVKGWIEKCNPCNVDTYTNSLKYEYEQFLNNEPDGNDKIPIKKPDHTKKYHQSRSDRYLPQSKKMKLNYSSSRSSNSD